MAIEDIPVWTIPPDWQGSVLESLGWLTVVMTSPFGVEQRYANRLSPRLSLEISFTIHGPERTFFDLLAIRGAGLPLYLPLWHEIEKLTADAAAGATSISLDTTFTEFPVVSFVFIQGPNPFLYEVAEIDSVADSSIGLTAALTNDWPAGTRVYPLKKFKVETQPSTQRKADRAFTSNVRFISLEPNKSVDIPPLGIYLSQVVLEEDPNDVSDLTYTYSRLGSTVDNQTGLQTQFDVSGLLGQQFSWLVKGRASLSRLRGLFYQLQGRRVAIWIPTFFADFDLVDDITDDGINVKRCGYTDMGGPSFNREHILIQLNDGTRHYRKILSSALIGEGASERLLIDTGFEDIVTKDSIKRISFLILGRMDQDTIELQHHADTKGATSVTAIFRSATDREGLENYEVSFDPGHLPVPTCLHDFRWDYSLGTTGLPDMPNALDKFGNAYGNTSTGTKVWNSSGAVISSMSQLDLADGIDAWFGSAVVHRGGLLTLSATGGYDPQPILDGNYIIGYMVASAPGDGAFAHWYVILRPSASGDPTVIGAVYVANLLGPPYLNYQCIMGPSNLKTVSDPILVRASHGIGGSQWVLSVLPPVADITSGLYHDGYPLPGYNPCQVPVTIIGPIGDTNLSWQLFVSTGGPNGNLKSGFLLPNAAGGTNLYFYMNRGWMDFQATATGALINPETQNVLQPAYPFGCILKIDVGLLDYVTLVTAIGSPTASDYSVDNLSWVDSALVPQIPFEDEYNYISTGNPDGNDVYTMEPGGIIRRDNGKFWIVFYMPGLADSFINTAGVLHETVRVFEYDPATEIATQIEKVSCIVYDTGNIPNDTLVIHDYAQALNILDSGSLSFVSITGHQFHTGQNGNVYKTNFCSFISP